jgi:ABC-type uncharacterized transport system ATPase subunit
MKKITSRIWQIVEERKCLIMLKSKTIDDLRYLNTRIQIIDKELE